MPFLVTVELAHQDGVAAHSFVNSWAVRTEPQTLSSDASYAATQVIGFYNDIPTGSVAAPGDLLSQEVSRAANAHTIKVYDLDGKLDGRPHGSPIYSAPWTLTRPGPPVNEGLPSEVAIVVTLEAVGRSAALVEAPDGPDTNTLVDRPKSRHTGRIFFGPVSQNMRSVEAQTNIVRVNGGNATILRNAVADLDAGLGADPLQGTLGLGVWSRADATMRPLFAVSTDNAFDVQRRRGATPTSRVRLEV